MPCGLPVRRLAPARSWRRGSGLSTPARRAGAAPAGARRSRLRRTAAAGSGSRFSHRRSAGPMDAGLLLSAARSGRIMNSWPCAGFTLNHPSWSARTCGAAVDLAREAVHLDRHLVAAGVGDVENRRLVVGTGRPAGGTPRSRRCRRRGSQRRAGARERNERSMRKCEPEDFMAVSCVTHRRSASVPTRGSRGRCRRRPGG